MEYKKIKVPVGTKITCESKGEDLLFTFELATKFKNGDFISTKIYDTNVVAIYKSDNPEWGINHHASFTDSEGLILNKTTNDCYKAEVFHYASEEEILKLKNALTKINKRWNTETLQIEDIAYVFKEGDICIFWDDDRKEAIVSILCDLDCDSYPYLANDGTWHQNALKFASTEQYARFIM